MAYTLRDAAIDVATLKVELMAYAIFGLSLEVAEIIDNKKEEAKSLLQNLSDEDLEKIPAMTDTVIASFRAGTISQQDVIDGLKAYGLQF